MAQTLWRTSSRAAGACQHHDAPACTSLRHPAVRPACLPSARATLLEAASNRRELTKVHAASSSATPQKETYDVFVYEPQPLKEGESKHTISVFVADEAGLINRVAGVFGRRGANIESLAVGLTVDKALFTIVVTGNEGTVANLVKQLSKLVKVRYVEDITKTDRIEREMVLMKLRCPPGADRTEVLQLSQIFRARVVDVSDNTVTLCVTGDPGKLVAIQKVMSKFGLAEIARTGRICLKRGDNLMEPGRTAPEGRRGNASLKGVPSLDEDDSAAAADDSAAGDVYVVDGDDSAPGVWEVDNVLDPTYSSGPSEFEPHTLSIEVQDTPGVLNQVTGVFARRGYNVQSLAVGPSEREGMSRICMVVPGSPAAISKLIKQLNKLIYVQKVTDLTLVPFVNRELLLVKVRCSAAQRGELRDLAAIFRGSIVDVSQTTCTIEVVGKEDKMKALTTLLESYGVLEVARTGRIAVSRESGVDNKFLEQVVAQRVW